MGKDGNIEYGIIVERQREHEKRGHRNTKNNIENGNIKNNTPLWVNLLGTYTGNYYYTSKPGITGIEVFFIKIIFFCKQPRHNCLFSTSRRKDDFYMKKK
jgi:hypothetical protein